MAKVCMPSGNRQLMARTFRVNATPETPLIGRTTVSSGILPPAYAYGFNKFYHQASAYQQWQQCTINHNTATHWYAITAAPHGNTACNQRHAG